MDLWHGRQRIIWFNKNDVKAFPLKIKFTTAKARQFQMKQETSFKLRETRMTECIDKTHNTLLWTKRMLDIIKFRFVENSLS